MSTLEGRVSPLLAARRASVKGLVHPGILPGVPRDEVAAYAIGVSKVRAIPLIAHPLAADAAGVALQGFMNHIHEDEMYAGLTGTITWDSSRVPPGAGFTFCVWPAQV